MSPIPSKVREQVAARSHGLCEAAIVANAPAVHTCKGRASVVHHKQRRNVGGHDLDNLLHLCSTPQGGIGEGCHEFIHRWPEWSRENGFIVSSYAEVDG